MVLAGGQIVAPRLHAGWEATHNKTRSDIVGVGCRDCNHLLLHFTCTMEKSMRTSCGTPSTNRTVKTLLHNSATPMDKTCMLAGKVLIMKLGSDTIGVGYRECNHLFSTHLYYGEVD